GVRFSSDGTQIEFSADESRGPGLVPSLQSLASQIQRSLRSLQRKVVFRSPQMDAPQFAGSVDLSDVHVLGPGQITMKGIPFALLRYFDRVFEDFGLPWKAAPLMAPALIPSRVLARCDYFRSFPQYVTFAAHLQEDVGVMDGFRARHQTGNDVD